MIAPLNPVNFSNGAPKAVSAPNACGSKPGRAYMLNTSFHFSNEPLGVNSSASLAVVVDGGL